MKKIYEYGKEELVGWDYKGIRIDINYYDITASGNWHKDYYVSMLKLLGKPCRFDTLKEAKIAIDEGILK